jgi:hypothetical protein
MKKRMRHVLGMAKSHLDLKGAKGPKLELDFLRLVYSVMRLRQKGDSALGYLIVMTATIADTVSGWASKYDSAECVIVNVASLSAEQMQRLSAEKQGNVEGMVRGTLGNAVEGKSDAPYGKSLAEEALRECIRQREPDAREVMNKLLFPFGIRWDYYGVSNNS